MAPEQFNTKPADLNVSPAFDVFALAVIACEYFLDGRHPSSVVRGIAGRGERADLKNGIGRSSGETGLDVQTKLFLKALITFLQVNTNFYSKIWLLIQPSDLRLKYLKSHCGKH
jgi:hypothetical protein